MNLNKKKPSAKCSACGRTVFLTKKGAFEQHSVGGLTAIKFGDGSVERRRPTRCMGSGKNPNVVRWSGQGQHRMKKG